VGNLVDISSINYLCLLQKFTLIKTTLIAWIAAIVMIWIVVANLGVLPYDLLYWAVPLSIIEVYIAALIIKRLSNTLNR
jgi:hypothetical protein